jgi:hypothetical protein
MRTGVKTADEVLQIIMNELNEKSDPRRLMTVR